MRTKSTGGFTLIELLIVIAIIGILAAVLIPNLMNARTTAAERAAQAFSSNVYTAAVAALADNVTWTPGDIGPADCDVTANTTVTGPGDAESAYSFNPAPAAVTSCEIGTAGNEVTVTVQTANFQYVNGVQGALP